MNDAATPTDAAAHPAPAAAAPVKRTPLIAGNWKMHFDHLQAIAFVQKLAWSLKDAQHNYGEVEVAVFPPFTDLRSVQTLLTADKLAVALGAQDVSPHASGAFTGDISAAMLKKLDTKYVIVGHSERRGGHGESDETVGLKARAAVDAGMIPVICVGETAEDLEAHGAAAIPVQQLTAVLAQLTADATFVVAYEPVWAIGSGEPATPAQAEEVGKALRDVLRAERGDDVANATRVLYGGSVASQNIASYMKQPNIDGALVGGASLKVDEFSRIAQFTKHVGV
ncbi:triose-phosphate isomerase [Leucobacter sp. BZR 635]|uniref:triose-phosphate isomerase n=1 Tax=Leucobacter sp. BZR 635 TaxID=3378705 RepID=UPI003A873F46